MLLTVMGLRAAGHRAMLVAHPAGELRRARREGLELRPARAQPRARSEGRLEAVAGLQSAPARHRPRARSRMRSDGRAGALDVHGRPVPPLVASRRVDFHLKTNSFSKWKHRQVDCSSPPPSAIARILRPTASRRARIATVHEGIDAERIAQHRAGERARGVLAADPRAHRRQHRRARAAQGAAASDRRGRRSSLRDVPDARVRDPRRG